MPDDVRNALSRLARRDQVPQATKAARLLETALELEEDQVWDAIANSEILKMRVIFPMIKHGNNV